jgi:hypothetical protein
MSLPNKKGVTAIIRDCCANIGLTFSNDPDNSKLLAFGIGVLVQQINDASGTSWSAGLEAFAGLIQLRFMKNGNVVIDFDETWFQNKDIKTIGDLVENLRKNTVELP